MEILTPLVGAKAWGPRVLVGSFIHLEFGEPRPYERDTSIMRGNWVLLTQLCEWRLEKDGNLLIGSENLRENINVALQELNGSILQKVDVQLPTLDTTLFFMNGVILRIFTVSFLRDNMHWVLYLPEDYQVLEVGPGKTWRLINDANAK
ncbi:MAG TPA: hypothetical protein PLT08_07690 [Anaerolineales bacterium]|nr:hypothetical protein [Anaerolineales bacterium]